MKKCPTCDKTFEDSMRFCQVDGTALVDDAPAFDPYATIVAHQMNPEPEASASVESSAVESPAQEDAEDQVEDLTPIEEPDDVLDLPKEDPLRTMYVSESELKAVIGSGESEENVIDIPPIEEVSEPARPSFLNSEPSEPPPSPFSVPENIPSAPEPEQPRFEEPKAEPFVPEEAAPPPRAAFDEAATMIQSSFDSPFESSEPAPPAEWTPPPAPEASWQNKEIGANTPFQPPVTGVDGQSKVLAIVSLVTGILSIFCCSSIFVVGIAAVITGVIARGKASSSPDEFGGKGLALAGIITGGVSFVIGILYWILILSGAITLPTF